jgi:very-short-patch-repair endonuclease
MDITATEIDKEFYKFESRAENSIALELQITRKNCERQYPIDKYFADFYFPEYNLVLEIDGLAYHSTPEAIRHDDIRNKFMNNLGYTVVRVSGSLANRNPSGILNTLRLFPKGRTFFLDSEQDIALAQKIALENA